MHCGASVSELQCALVFHRKCLGKRLEHQLQVRHTGVCGGIHVLILGSLYTLCWVSLIAGVGYRVEQWVENGMERWV